MDRLIGAEIWLTIPEALLVACGIAAVGFAAGVAVAPTLRHVFGWVAYVWGMAQMRRGKAGVVGPHQERRHG